MELRRFRVKEMHGYISLDVSFNKDVTFLTGPNGSGKTSAIKLMESMLVPSIAGLAITPFKSAELILIDNGKEVIISARSSKGNIAISVSDVPQPFEFSEIDSSEWSVISQDPDRLADYSERLQVRNSSQPAIKRIASLNAPLILGVDRRVSTGEDFFDDAWLSMARSKRRSISKAHRFMSASLSAGISETRTMVSEAFRRARKRESISSSKLVKSMIKALFSYSDPGLTSFDSDYLFSKERRDDILSRKPQIEEVLKKSDLHDKDLSLSIKEYFDRLEGIFNRLPYHYEEGFFDKYPGLAVEWLLNRAQLDRFLMVMEKMKAEVEVTRRFYEPIDKFLHIINEFFSDSRKKVSVDPLGNLSFITPEGEQKPVEALSSGEKQLLIIFSHAIFNQYATSSGVLIVDEPELSMHLRWQQMFVEKLMSACPSNQFIFATHSPDIVENYMDKAVVL